MEGEAHLQLSGSSEEDLLSNTIDDDPNGLYQSQTLSSQTQDINLNPYESSQKKRSWKDSHSDPRTLRKKKKLIIVKIKMIMIPAAMRLLVDLVHLRKMNL